MDFLRAATLAEALELKARRPDALPIAGGTDVMVELNFDRRRPGALLDLSRIAELTTWSRTDSHVRLGAGVPYARIAKELADVLPGLAIASRSIGSPQIRSRGTVGGNLGSASPAGDAHPPLLASGAAVEAASMRGVRQVPIDEFFTGVRRNALEPDELIVAVHVPVSDGPQQFAKVGTRNAMVIAVCSFAVALHPSDGSVRTGIGSAAPTPVRARAAEDFAVTAMRDLNLWERGAELPADVAAGFGALVADAAAPIDDVRGTAAYRRHALSVIARRALRWVFESYQLTDGMH